MVLDGNPLRPGFGGQAAERVTGVSGTADFFKVLGVSPAIGRGFLPEECVPGAASVAVISDGMWRRVFGATPDAIGRTVTLNDRPYTVIGVMPAGFSYEPAADLWYPLQLRVDARDRGFNYAVVGRLPPGPRSSRRRRKQTGSSSSSRLRVRCTRRRELAQSTLSGSRISSSPMCGRCCRSCSAPSLSSC